MLELSSLHAPGLKEKESKKGLLAHIASLADPYVAVRSPSLMEGAVQTAVQLRTLNPRWKDTLVVRPSARFFFPRSRSMPTANAEDLRRSEGTKRRVSPRPFRRCPPDSI